MESSNEIMSYLARKYFHNRCRVTLKTFKPNSGFTIHHIREIENDVLSSQFPKTEIGRMLYLNALKPLVEAEPERFALITRWVHTRIDHPMNGLSRLKKDNLDRLYDLAKETIHIKKTKGKRRHGK